MATPALDLGPVRLLRPVARGSTAEVWRAVHRPTGEPVAVKVLAGFTADEARMGDFAREVRAVAGLDHRAIVRVHDYGAVPAAVAAAATRAGFERLAAEAPYLIMDWHGGGTLRRKGAVPDFATLRRHLLSVLDGLAHAHARGVIHRDLKPANVLLGASGAVLSDFGVVFSMNAAIGRNRGASGTPNYMAPEQVTDDWRSFGPWTDLYAVGCIAWTLCTGRAPYGGSGPLKAMKGHLRGALPDFQPRMAVPVGFEAWLQRALARPPTGRFRFAVDAARALRALVPDADDGSTSTGTVGAVDALGPEDRTVITLADADRTTIDPTSGVHQAVTGELMAVARPAWAAERPPMPTEPPLDPPPAPGARLLDCGRALAELRMPALRGRADEQALLWRRLTDVLHQQGARAVVLEGPRGVGKSALAQWLSSAAHAAGQAIGLQVVHAPAVVDGGDLEAAVLRRLGLDGLDPEDVAYRARTRLGFDPWTAVALAALASPDRSASVGEHAVSLSGDRAVFATLVDALVALGGDRAVLLRFEDVHWSERALRFVRFVLRRRAQAPLLMVMTARTEAEGSAAAGRLLDALAGYPAVARCRIGSIDCAALGEAIDARLPLTAPARARLLRTAGGDPLFVSELMRFWVHTDALESTADGHRVRDDRPDAWPPSPGALWRTRLDRLAADWHPDPLPAVEVAAILGLEFDRSEWGAALKCAGLEHPERAVEGLLDAGLLATVGADRFVFTRAALRDALQQRARDAGRWARANAACAAGLEVIRALGTVVEPSRIAAHHDGAGRPDLALPLWRAAVDRSRARIGEMTPAVAPVLFAAARAARRTGMRRADPVFIGLMISWSAQRNFGRRGSGLRHARRALELARATDDLAIQGRAMRQLARCLRQHRRLDEAKVLLDETEDVVRRSGDAGMLAETYKMQCQIELRRGHVDRAELLARAALDVPCPPVPARDGLILNLLGEIHRERGELDEAAAAYAAGARCLGDADMPLRWAIRINQGLVALARGDLDGAAEAVDEAARRAARSGDRMVRMFAEVVRLIVAAERGLADEWDRAWSLLAALLTDGMKDREFADLLARATRAAAGTLPARAPAARPVAVALYRSIGADAEAKALEQAG